MRFRLFSETDFPVCAGLVHSGFAPGSISRAELTEIWRQLLRAGQLLGGVLVDHPGDDQTIVACGPAVFVSDAFADEALRAPRPFLSARIYDAIREGRSPVLDIEEVRHANAGGGLNLVILHYGQADWDFTHPLTRTILDAAHVGFRLGFNGYRLRRILEEVCVAQLPIKRAAGFLVKSTYGRPIDDKKADVPVLVGLCRDDEASRLPGSTASSAFHYQEPRFFFSLAEQRLLVRAVIDEADDRGIAARLGVSADAIRQTWRRIYDRVADVDASVFGVDLRAIDRAGTRGPEKRRHLLEYLRFHPEELRPSIKRSTRPALAQPVLQ